MSAPASSSARRSNPTPRPPTRSARARAPAALRLRPRHGADAVVHQGERRGLGRPGRRRRRARASRGGRRTSLRRGRPPRPRPTPARRRWPSPSAPAFRPRGPGGRAGRGSGPRRPPGRRSAQAARTWPWISLSPTTMESRLGRDAEEVRRGALVAQQSSGRRRARRARWRCARRARRRWPPRRGRGRARRRRPRCGCRWRGRRPRRPPLAAIRSRSSARAPASDSAAFSLCSTGEVAVREPEREEVHARSGASAGSGLGSPCSALDEPRQELGLARQARRPHTRGRAT